MLVSTISFSQFVQKPKRRIKRVIFYCMGMALLSLTSGCSFVEFGYNQLPSLVANNMEMRFDLDEHQYDDLQDQLFLFLQWHRANEVVQYETFLRKAAGHAAKGIEQDEILWLIEEIRHARNRSLIRLIQQVSEIGISLSPEQINHFKRSRLKKHKEFRQEKVNAEDNATLEAEERLEQIENLTGTLTGKVREDAIKQLLTIPEIDNDLLNYRVKRDHAIIKALQTNQQPTALARQLIDAMTGPDSQHAKSYEPIRRQYWVDFSKVIVRILQSLPEDNKQQIVENLNDYADIAKRIAE